MALVSRVLYVPLNLENMCMCASEYGICFPEHCTQTQRQKYWLIKKYPTWC